MSHVLQNLARSARVLERWQGETDLELRPIVERPYRPAREYRPFSIVQLSDTSVEILAGAAIRHVHGLQYAVEMGIDGGVTSKSLADSLTISGVTATTHIVLDLNNPLIPTTLTASSTGSATYPTGDTTYARRVLGKITCAGNVITGIEQYEDGHWRDPWMQPDSASLNYAVDNLLQFYGWDVASAVAPANVDLFPYQDLTNGLAAYCTAHQIVETGAADGADLAGAVWTNAPWLVLYAINHQYLTGLNNGPFGDEEDHHWAWNNGTHGGTCTSARNYGSSVGNALGKLVLDLDNGQLLTGGTSPKARLDWLLATLLANDGSSVRYDWDTGIFYDASVAGSLNHLLRTLDGNKSASVGWQITSSLASHAVTEGALVVTGTGGAGIGGTLAATQVQIGTGALSYWNATDFVNGVSGKCKIAAFGGDGRVHILSTERLMLDYSELWINNAQWEACAVSALSDTDTVLRRKP